MSITGHPVGWEAMRARLRRALEHDLFVLHFQPIVSLSDGRVVRHEALLRLADGGDGRLVAPGEFLPAAERHGLIGEIDRWVLRHVIWLLSGHDGAALASGVAANISALSVSDPSLAGELEEMFERFGVEPSMLVLEITETAAIPDIALARSFCARVLELGCEIALDDFGAGYGGLHLLRELPFSYLKIDKEFVRRLASSRADRMIVAALHGLSRDMESETVAECVSDRETIAILRDIGVELAQGFALGRPAPLLAAAA
jgi:EAL domain-containing protein (putative c-di-GMP-specific phosphodiesterase class I)